ncbi:pao retrotransposon peptidase domain-containing protein [Phthorimaea operculella]|nr:pao retrotransposon peptidase domain-containing protein [Phthorimaea operculella]
MGIRWPDHSSKSPTGYRGSGMYCIELWLANLGWDDQLSGELLKDWLKFVTTLPGIVHIAIHRKLVPSVGCKATLHGFCDASERGYAAAVYLRTASSTGTVHVRLVMAKSKVAPVRTRWTIPKLELAGAALLARLLNHVTCNLRGTINLDETVYAWTDSRIVLCWLQTSEWPFNECRAPLGPPDRGLRVNVGQLVPKPNPAFLLERYSSLDKLLGVTGWIKRFVNNCRKPQAERNFTPVLSPAERNAALRSLVRVVQAEHFEEEAGFEPATFGINTAETNWATAVLIEPAKLWKYILSTIAWMGSIYRDSFATNSQRLIHSLQIECSQSDENPR